MSAIVLDGTALARQIEVDLTARVTAIKSRSRGVSPILATILAVAASEQTVAKGAGLLAIYSLGLGIPFLAAAFAVEPFAKFLARFRAYLPMVEKTMGALLVLTGVAFLTGFVTDASYWLLETFPVLGKIG